MEYNPSEKQEVRMSEQGGCRASPEPLWLGIAAILRTAAQKGGRPGKPVGRLAAATRGGGHWPGKEQGLGFRQMKFEMSASAEWRCQVDNWKTDTEPHEEI